MLLFCGTKAFDCLTCSLLIVVSVTDTNLCFPNCTCVVLCCCCCLICCCGIRRSFDTQNVSVHILYMVATGRVVLVVNGVASVGAVVVGV